MVSPTPDLRQAVRALRRRPGFTVVAVATIALAIAANTAMFSVVYGVLLRPLPFPDPGRLVTVDVRASTGFTISTSMPNYRDFRDRSRVFSGVAGADGFSFTLLGDGPAQIIDGTAVIGDFFDLFGMRAALGRVPGPEETKDEDGMPSVVVLTHAFWQQRFGADPAILGRAISLGGRPYTVVGVLPPGVSFPSSDAGVYVPMGSIPGLPWNVRTAGFGTEMFARLRENVDLSAARADMARVGREQRAELGAIADVPEVRSLREYLVGDVARQVWLLMGAVTFVLLIAVANVGNLLLARGEERHRELAVRAALGAGRGALARLMLAEAMIISLTGALLGAGLAYALVGALVPLLPADLPPLLLSRIGVDATVLAFAVGVALVAGVVFGLLPTVPARHLDLAAAMKAGSRSVTVGGGRLRPALVVGEVALAVTVLIGAGLTLESLDHLSTVDAGFRAPGVLTAAVPASARRYPTKEQWRGFYDELRDHAAALPGVRTAALTLLLPLSHRSWELRVHPEGEPLDREHAHSVLYNVVSPEYFATLSVPIIRGRSFTAADRDGAPLVAIIDQTMAGQFWPGQDPIGKRITLEEADDTVVYRTVVGVTPNLRHYRLDAPSRIEVYVPIDQTFKRWGMTMRLAVRADGDPAALAAPLRALVTSVDPEAPLFQVEPLAGYVEAELARPRAMTRVLAAFGAAAAALVALGIFGVMSYDVTRRTREIAIRMAVGAAARDVLQWVGMRALRLTAIGLALGLVAAALLMRYMARLLYDVHALDPASYGLAAAGLGLVALLAAGLPARRATRVDPVTVLNEE